MEMDPTREDRMTNDTPGTGALQPLSLAPGLWQADFPSGLRLIVREDHRSPVAVCNVWVRVGSNLEPEALRGWSHGIEHMLFKGTARRQDGDFAREVADAGGSTNAGTGYETTNYHVTVPAERLATAVDLLGDALFGSRFEAASLEAERGVLVHENHMYDDRPAGYGVTWRWGLERAFDRSPYRHPIGGRDENLRERSRDDVLAFWRSGYRPGNMTVVVVGDVDPRQACELVAAHFPVADGAGPAPVNDPRTALVAAPPVEPSHDGARCRVEYGEIAKAYVKLILPAPGEGDPRRDALPVVRRILGDGRSCRLYSRVQEEARLVDDIDVVTETGPREGLFMVEFETDPPRLRRALEEVAAVLADLATGGSTADERSRAANRVLASHLFGAESVQGQAANLGYHDSIGDLAGALDLPARIAAVTADDVVGLARAIFRQDDLTAMLYLPHGTEPAAHGIPVTDAELAAVLEPLLAPVLAPPVTTTVPRSLPRRQAAAGPADQLPSGFTVDTLPGGGEVVWCRDTTVPVVAMSFVATGGSTDETAAGAAPDSTEPSRARALPWVPAPSATTRASPWPCSPSAGSGPSPWRRTYCWHRTWRTKRWITNADSPSPSSRPSRTILSRPPPCTCVRSCTATTPTDAPWSAPRRAWSAWTGTPWSPGIGRLGPAAACASWSPVTSRPTSCCRASRNCSPGCPPATSRRYPRRVPRGGRRKSSARG